MVMKAERQINIKDLVIEEPERPAMATFEPDMLFPGTDFARALNHIRQLETERIDKSRAIEMTYKMHMMFGDRMPLDEMGRREFVTHIISTDFIEGTIPVKVGAIARMRQLNPGAISQVTPQSDRVELIHVAYDIMNIYEFGSLVHLANLKLALPNEYAEHAPKKETAIRAMQQNNSVSKIQDAAMIRIMFPETQPDDLLERKYVEGDFEDFLSCKKVGEWTGAIRWAFNLAVFSARQVEIEDGRISLGFEKPFIEEPLPLPETRRF